MSRSEFSVGTRDKGLMKPEEALFANRLMQTHEEVRAFDAALARAAEVGVSELELAKLLEAFDDTTKHSDVMFGLVHLVDAFDVTRRIRGLVERAAVLRERAPEWLRVLLYRSLNHPPSHAELQRVLRTSPESSAALRATLEEISTALTPVGERARLALSTP